MPPTTLPTPGLPAPRRPRRALKRRTALLILALGLIVLITGVLWLVASIWSARQLRLWGFVASPVIAPGVSLTVAGCALLSWWRIGTRRR